jgi:hypothetical protein
MEPALTQDMSSNSLLCQPVVVHNATPVASCSYGGRGRGRGRGKSSGGSGRGHGIGRGSGGSREATGDKPAGQINGPVQEVARDGTVWKSLAPDAMPIVKMTMQNILRETPGPTGHAKRNIDDTVTSAFRLLIDKPLLRHIQRATVEQAHCVQGSTAWEMSLDELDAFLAILYARGAYGAKGLSLKSLWSSKWGPPFFRDTMSRNRFMEIMKYLRFDLKSTRSIRLQTDQFALASTPWNTFIANSILCYKPGENITIDEQLFPTKARCKWTQYIASKPDKFGIKFWLAVDVSSKYLVNGAPYLGKDEARPPGLRLSDSVVMNLMDPYMGKGRNVTTDNFFTSLKLAKDLKLKKTSIVGTVNRVRRELPTSVLDVQCALHSTRLHSHSHISLTTYRCKPKKNVVLMSTLHPTVSIGNDEKKLPETVQFYNNTKYGVDIVDQMARKYSVKAGGRRWPVHVFYNILDLAAINSWILYKEVTGKIITRRDFILQLAEELCDAYVKTRPHRAAAVQTTDGVQDTVVNRKRRHCQVAKCNGLKTFDNCTSCNKAVCGKCTAKMRRVCVDCDSDTD